MKYAIDVENVSITYKCVKSRSIKKSLFSFKKSDVQLVEAVRGVSFRIPQGEIVGIVGKNGSGKSTMLRAIAGIFTPDSGTIDLHGHSISLLAIGVGFQKALTGRENIMLTGTLLGFSEKYMLEKMDEIIEFAELGKFIDMPVKTYSSGMFSKLSFSITANLKTDIMLVDEVLSVGDVKFKKKSYEKMRELISDEKRTVVIVSHNMDTLKKLCSRIIWLHDGELKMYGDVDEVLDAYMEFMD
ncbi:MAG: ABC transporter ATP-binding protein [Lachnospiraceae bacterium]|nr:ABC transporter ATP-binding protein [Lachnospiraceae bacterium]